MFKLKKLSSGYGRLYIYLSLKHQMDFYINTDKNYFSQLDGVVIGNGISKSFFTTPKNSLKGKTSTTFTM